MNDLFRFTLDADIEKSDSNSGRRIIKGYASTAQKDRQGESLVQKGLDISDFINHGYFNYDHDNSIILGYPHSTCRVDDHGLWVEGELLKGIPQADRMWELALALKKSNAPRRVGFSVEGKVLQREGTKVLKAKIYNVAITANPVNTSCTWDAVVKSFSSLEKALEAGYPVNPLELEGGEVFCEESLESDLKNLSYVIGNEEKKKVLKEKLSKSSLSGNQLVLYLQVAKGWSAKEAQTFITNNLL